MRKLTVNICIPMVLLFLFFSHILQAQMIINSGPEVTPIDMVECILGEGVQYDNVTFQGADISRGIFSNGDSTNIGIDKGVFLTSGAGYIIPGPNNSTNAGFNNGLGGHPLLDAISPYTIYDAAVLEFDFIPENDTLSIEFVFGSEEYAHDYVPSITDIMGIFITGPDPGGGFYNDLNIALVPDTILPVNCHNINNFNNSQYYIDNDNGTTLQYDGFTTVLVAWLLVVPSEEYHVTIGIADGYDKYIDSGIFLEENSLEAKSPRIKADVYLQPPGILDSLVEEFITADIVFKLLYPDTYPITFDLELNGTADPSAYPPGDFEEEVPTQITFEEGEDSITIQIKAVYDGIIEGDEFLDLIIEIPYTNYSIYDTLTLTILDYLEMNSQTSPNTMICFGQELDMWVHAYNGIPPYTYYWEPGGYTNDSITVSPEETGYYKVTYSDIFTSKSDSILVTVFPVCELETFYFETYLNPGLLYDVFGNVMGDTVFIVFPPGTNLNGLIPSFTFSNEACSDAVGTVTDFSEPIVYQYIGPGGCMSEWIVVADIETGNVESKSDEISIFPNPAKEKLIINHAQGNTITILNNLGVELCHHQINSSDFAIELSSFEEGIYFLQFKNDRQILIKKVIVNR